MFKDRMIIEAIPERVYALCCCLKDQPIKKNELRNRLEPEELIGDSPREFSKIYNAAQELKLIREDEDMAIINIDGACIDSKERFKHTIIKSISEYLEESLFFKVTKAYLNLNEEIFKFNTSTSVDMCKLLQSSLDNQVSIDEKDMRAWRFWVSYLGIGVLHGTLFIPNMYGYLKTILDHIGMEVDREYTFKEFIHMIEPLCKFALPSNDNKSLNLGISNGIRQLHDMEFLELKYTLDSADKWYLNELEGHEYTSLVTHVVRRR